MIIPRFLSLPVVFMLIFLGGCQDKVVSPYQSSAAGEHTLNVSVFTYDEFQRPITSSGPVSLLLTGQDRHATISIPAGRSSCEIHGLQLGEYLLTAQKDGYYTYETAAGGIAGNGNWSPVLQLYPRPSPAWRIDSIKISSSSSSNKVTITLLTSRIAPPAYLWRAALFFSSSPAIDPSTGTYDFDSNSAAWGGGNAITVSMMNYEFARYHGTRVYVTARLMTPVTEIFLMDSTSGRRKYANLEENTTVVSSFIAP